MSNRLQDASLRFLGLNEGTGLYGLYGTEYTNHYYLLSGPGTRRLMAFPEVVGYASPISLRCPPPSPPSATYFLPARAAMSIYSPSSAAA